VKPNSLALSQEAQESTPESRKDLIQYHVSQVAFQRSLILQQRN